MKDSLPRSVITSDEHPLKLLDRGHGNCFLKNPKVVKTIKDFILSQNKYLYELHAWVIIPNHVHLLLTPIEQHPISEIIKKLKGATARQSNIILKRIGNFWHREYFDRYIRNDRHFQQTCDYIELNPVKVGLCKTRHDWKFSSAFHNTAIS